MAGNALRNDDFRKLLAAGTPRSNAGAESADSKPAAHSFTHKQQRNADGQPKKKKTFRPPQTREKKEKTETDEIFDESDARLQSILSKYRDRAAERRKGGVDGQDVELRAKIASGLHTFRDEDRDLDAIDRREQEIRVGIEVPGRRHRAHSFGHVLMLSFYFNPSISVRGLDYQLLNKTRDEIKAKPEEAEEQAEVILAEQNPVTKNAYLNKVAKSKMSRAVCRTLFEFEPPVRNELFQRGRMAYVVELDDPQQDVPVTLLRSTFECSNDRVEQNISANNLVIEKLTEILTVRPKSPGPRAEEATRPPPAAPVERTPFKTRAMPAASHPPADVPPVKKSKYEEEDAYGELFPSSGMGFGGDDSDEEDMSKMDLGNKKGPVKRWDFNTEEEFERYKSNQEALPKAAFQFGIKSNAGRKTRKTNAAAEERRLDREYEKNLGDHREEERANPPSERWGKGSVHSPAICLLYDSFTFTFH
ncbi:hypothetical protein M3Y99_00553800 [Aphelenchoides fujianensis]|nr:hypothetical protein M3Y99_00553800 [Aphelenchoides fujianensis]